MTHRRKTKQQKETEIKPFDKFWQLAKITMQKTTRR